MAFLRAGILGEDGVERDTSTGTPQGGILSPLLASIALSVLDEHFVAAWAAMGAHSGAHHQRRLRGLATYRLVRYADDCVPRMQKEDRVEDRATRCSAVPEMEAGPPESPYRGRLQTTAGCAGQEPGW